MKTRDPIKSEIAYLESVISQIRGGSWEFLYLEGIELHSNHLVQLLVKDEMNLTPDRVYESALNVYDDLLEVVFDKALRESICQRRTTIEELYWNDVRTASRSRQL